MCEAISILGSKWGIAVRSSEDDPRLSDCDGYCDWSVDLIVIRKEGEEDGNLTDMEAYMRKVLRHEIVHAFLFESGLAHSSCSADAWAVNEEMVDWFALMGERIYKAWMDAGALDAVPATPKEG